MGKIKNYNDRKNRHESGGSFVLVDHDEKAEIDLNVIDNGEVSRECLNLQMFFYHLDQNG